jgi:siroheme synthase
MDDEGMLRSPVCFIGGGPGAPDLLTLRAAERLKRADVLVWTDSLVCPAIATGAESTASGSAPAPHSGRGDPVLHRRHAAAIGGSPA